jgi:indolepyruvate ferredoxin oxidoreductase
MAGIGGTGIVTVNQVLGMAATLAGLSVRSIDQIGSSQKAGPVISMLRIDAKPTEGAARIAEGMADGFIAFDLLTASSDDNLRLAHPSRTVLVGNSDPVPTGTTVTDVAVPYPEKELLLSRLQARMASTALVFDGLRAARLLFANEIAANMLMVGAACQTGVLPIPPEAIEAAIQMNGVSVKTNLTAFRWGRFAAIDLPGFEQVLARRERPPVAAPTVPAAAAARIAGLSLHEETTLRYAELAAFQDEAYADSYLAELEEHKAAGLVPAALTAAARQLYKLMAYKDEYEVARLFVEAYDRDRASGRIAAGQKFKWWLHPTFLRKLGVRKKVAMGQWFVPFARVLAWARRFRGTSLDLFGIGIVRSQEKALIGEYRELLTKAVQTFPNDAERQQAIADLPDMIRGYEDVKLDNIKRFRAKAIELISQINLAPKEAVKKESIASENSAEELL